MEKNSKRRYNSYFRVNGHFYSRIPLMDERRLATHFIIDSFEYPTCHSKASQKIPPVIDREATEVESLKVTIGNFETPALVWPSGALFVVDNIGFI